MRKVDVAKATVPELREIAIALGLDPHPNLGEANLRAKIAAAWDKPEYSLPDAPPEAAQVAARSTKAKGTPEKVRLIINVTEEPGGTDPVPLGVNGRMVTVQRDVEVDLPYAYYLVLAAAVKFQYDPLPDGKGLNPIPRKVPMYPFQVLLQAA